MRHAKIVCTMGPACNTEDVIAQMLAAGMNCARLNFSHGSHKSHGEMIRKVRKVAKKLDRSVAILADLQGPKIRTGPLEEGKAVRLKEGALLWITTHKITGNAECVSTTYQALVKDVQVGSRIMLDDGTMELKVVRKERDRIQCRIIVGGMLHEYKGINLPGIKVSAPSLSAKDKRDLRFALRQDVNYIALSFVRQAADVLQVRKILGEKHKHVKLIAKIERPEAVNNLDAILDAADGVMVARGDLGVEMDPARVAILQKNIIRRANAHQRVVITATQMMQTMIRNPRPTRAEISDISNAIYDGTDAVMLSGETANGKYPVKVVQTMSQIIREVEADIFERSSVPHDFKETARASLAQCVVDAACYSANVMKIPKIFVFTQYGQTAWLASMGRPVSRIMAFTAREFTYHSLSLAWGVHPILTRFVKDPHKLYSTAVHILKRRKMIKRGDKVLLIAGTAAALGYSNTLRFEVVD